MTDRSVDADEVPEFFDEITRLNNELTNAHRELARKNARLQRADEVKNQVLGMATHDLRTPLSTIVGFAEILHDGGEQLSASERGEIAEMILDASRSMLGLVEELLDFTAVEAGVLHLAPEPVDPVGLVERGLLRGRIMAAAKEIEVRMEADDVPEVTLDPRRFGQVVDNLVSNAVKYSPKGSTVLVRMSIADDLLVVSVADEGPGVPPEERHRLFRAFGTTSAVPTGGEATYGLGLVIVRRIVEAHGGTAALEPSDGPGATFTATFSLDGPTAPDA